MYRLEVWRIIRDMKDRRMINKEIAGDLGISRNTVSKLLRTTRLADHCWRNFQLNCSVKIGQR